MANRDLGIVPLSAYLMAWWGGVALFGIWITSNSAPGAPQLAWHDAEAFTTTKLTIDIATPAPDPDGDVVTYTYVWERNGEVVPEETGPALSNRATRAGETWRVTVTPDDGTFGGSGCGLPWRECAGEVSASAEITISNTPPRARLRIQDTEGNDIEELQARQDVQLALSCFDADLIDRQREAVANVASAATDAAEVATDAEPEKPKDPCTYTVAWWPADAEITDDAEPPFTGLTMGWRDLRQSSAWKIIVVANDGEDDGEPLEETIAFAP